MNIDTLSLQNFTMATDSMVINYDNTKMDQTGDKTTPKNAHANPFDFKICPFVALGIFLAAFEELLDKDKQYLFINEGCKIGSASDKYCKALRNLFTKNIDVLSEHNHCSDHR